MNIIERNNVNVEGNTGPVLLFAFGFDRNQNRLNRVTLAFASTHLQALFDYVGSGKSDLASFDAKRYTGLQGYAQDVLDVCDALDLHSGITFVGYSVSSSVGLLASIARPELFDRLVMIGPSPCFLYHPPDYLGGFEREDLVDLLSLMNQNYIDWTNYLAPMVAGEYLHAHLQDNTLKVLDMTGHCGHMSHPSLVIEAMREYLDVKLSPQ